jgi:energy-coupling factor transport system substrate-specific component
MSWQLGALAILALALAGGFAWYERTRPDARIVALVGTLAAFAALGRIAFAALPNVKPTTDIVLVSGYALGGGPGFAVGALGGLASNFFFGQGPWTPWQMAGWGVTGVIGAGLAVVTRGRIGRWPLALVCAAVGFAFTVLQDVGDWVTYSDHSLAALGVYVGKGIGFDCVHAAGCLLFALAFGPALIRSLSRFATRLKVTWRPVAPPLALILALTLTLSVGWLAGQPSLGGGGGVGAGGGGGVGAGVGVAQAAGTPAGYLLAAQNADGGYGPAPRSPSSQLYAGWVALGLAAAGENPAEVARGEHDLLGYIQAGVGSATDPGSVERTILVARAAGLSPTSFGGRNLLGALERDVRPNGSVSDQVNLTAFAVLALRSASVALPPRTLGWMVRQQDSDGGFNFGTRGGSSDVDDTGAVLEALAGAGGPGPAHARSRAVQYLRRQQDADGGFPAMPGAGSNAQSTAFAVQGLLAAGVDPGSLRRRGASPLDYLHGLITADGHVRYSRSADQSPVWATAEALLALESKPLPLAPVARRAAASAHRGVPRATTPRHAVAKPPAATGRHASPRHRATAAGATGPRPVAPPASDVDVDRFASYAGILTALTLAPLGQD